MIKLLETFKINNGVAPYLAFHNERLNESRQRLFNAYNYIDLATFIQPPSAHHLYKCRVIYAHAIEKVEYHLYEIPKINCFKVIAADDITYEFKYLCRTQLNQLVANKGAADDILIIKNGLVTDTSIANVAFWDQDRWLTPSTPLLKGTTRARLLRAKQIWETNIYRTDLKKFSKMAIMNALMDFMVLKDFQLLF